MSMDEICNLPVTLEMKKTSTHDRIENAWGDGRKSSVEGCLRLDGKGLSLASREV